AGSAFAIARQPPGPAPLRPPCTTVEPSVLAGVSNLLAGRLLVWEETCGVNLIFSPLPLGERAEMMRTAFPRGERGAIRLLKKNALFADIFIRRTKRQSDTIETGRSRANARRSRETTHVCCISTKSARGAPVAAGENVRFSTPGLGHQTDGGLLRCGLRGSRRLPRDVRAGPSLGHADGVAFGRLCGCSAGVRSGATGAAPVDLAAAAAGAARLPPELYASEHRRSTA